MMKSGRMIAAVTAMAVLGGCSVFKSERKHTPVIGQRVPILIAENEVVPDKTIAAVPVVVPAAVANPAWSQPGGSPSKAMGHLALPDTLSRAWSTQIPGGNMRERLAAAPVVVDGTLYVMDTQGSVHAISADSGSTLWTRQTAKGEENRSARFGGGVSFDSGKLYATNGLGDVVALDAATGNELWRKRPGGPLRGAPTIANGNVYVLSQDNQLFALDQGDGRVVWTQSGSLESQGVFGVAAPAAAQGSVVVGFSTGELNAYRYENGRSLWGDSLSRTSMTTSVSALTDIDAEPVIDNGRVYAIGEGGRMVSLEMTSGQRLWEQNIGGISTPWVAGDWIFVATQDAKLIAIARDSGRIRWISQLRRFHNEKKKEGAINWVGPVLAGNRLLLTNNEGEIVSASVTDGSVISTQATKESFTIAPVVAGNTLFLLDDTGRLSAWR